MLTPPLAAKYAEQSQAEGDGLGPTPAHSSLAQDLSLSGLSDAKGEELLQEPLTSIADLRGKAGHAGSLVRTHPEPGQGVLPL